MTGRLDAEFCVIGSGPAGSVVAMALAKAGHEVLILEAGASGSEASTDDTVATLDCGSDVNLSFGRAFQVGGSSNLWAGRVAPFEPIDFEARAFMPGTGWPLSADSLDGYFAQAYALMGMTARPDIPKPPAFSDLGMGDADAELEIKAFSWSRPPLNIGHVLLAEMARNDKLTLLAQAPVIRLNEHPDEPRIETVTVIQDGAEREVRARCFILAAGGLETPRLLLASTGKSGAGIGNRHDQVGRYFSTHPKVDMASIVLNKRTATSHPLFTDCPMGHDVVRGGIGFTADAQRRLELPNHYVQLSPTFEYNSSRLFEAVKQSKAINAGGKSRTMRPLLAAVGGLSYEMIGRLAPMQFRARRFVLRAFLDQLPDPAHRVTLSPQRDRHGVPMIDVRWRLTDWDRQSVRRFFEELDRCVRAANVGEVVFDLFPIDGPWPITAIHSHFMGTTRMSADPETGVVDADCRVHGLENLYISGPSVFPAYGYSNPFLTIAAMSYRLADHLSGASAG